MPYQHDTYDRRIQLGASRRRRVDEILTTMNLSLGGYPFVDYALQTPQEASHQVPVPPIQLPLWSEILMAPEPDNPVPLDDDTTKRPFIFGELRATSRRGLLAAVLAELHAPATCFYGLGMTRQGQR